MKGERQGEGGGRKARMDIFACLVHVFESLCSSAKLMDKPKKIGIENGKSGQLRLLLGLILGGELGGSQAGICSEGRG